MNNRQKAKKFKKKYEELEKMMSPKKGWVNDFISEEIEQHVAKWRMPKKDAEAVNNMDQLKKTIADILVDKYLKDIITEKLDVYEEDGEYVFIMDVWVRR